MRESRRRGASSALVYEAKVKYDGPEEIWSDRTARSDESGAEEALVIRASRYSLADFTSAAAETAGRSDVVFEVGSFQIRANLIENN